MRTNIRQGLGIDQGSSSSYWTQQLFDSGDGLVINTSKWTVTNPNPTSATFEKRNALVLNTLNVSQASAYSNNIKSTKTQAVGCWVFSMVDMQACNYINSKERTGLIDSNNQNGIEFKRTGADKSILTLNIFQSGSSVYSIATTINDFAIIKILIDSSHNIKVYYLFNDVWVQIGTTQTYDIGTLTVFMSSAGEATNLEMTKNTLRDVFIEDSDIIDFVSYFAKDRTPGLVMDGSTDNATTINAALIAGDVHIVGGYCNIASAILIPSNRTLWLKNARIKMANNSLDTFVRNKDFDAGNVNVSVIGLGNFVFDSNNINNDDGYATYPTYGVMYHYYMFGMINVNGGQISGINIAEYSHWGTVLQKTRNFTVNDLYYNYNFVSGVHQNNKDGIDIIIGCNNLTISNIIGRCQDDVIAIVTGQKSGIYYALANWDVGEIHDIAISNITIYGGLAGIMRFFGEGVATNSMYNISVSKFYVYEWTMGFQFVTYSLCTTNPTKSTVHDITLDQVTVIGGTQPLIQITEDCSNITFTNTTYDTPELIRISSSTSNVSVNGTYYPIPVLQRAIIENAAPSNIVMPYYRSLDETSVPATTDYAVTVNGSARAVNTVAVSGYNVTLTLASACVNGDTVVVSYTPGTNKIQVDSHTPAASLTNYSVINNVGVSLPTVGLVAQYEMNGDATDSSGNGYDLTNNNAVLCADKNAVANGAYSLVPASSAWLTRSAFTQVQLNKFTVSIRFKANALTNMDCLIGCLDIATYAGGWGIFYSSTYGKLIFFVNSWTSIVVGVTFSDTASWHNIVASFDSDAISGQQLKLQLDNGTVLTTGSYSGAINYTNCVFDIGKGYGPIYMNAYVDEPIFYNRELSQAEKTQLYNHYIAPPSSLNTGLVLYAPLNETSGNALDSYDTKPGTPHSVTQQGTYYSFAGGTIYVNFGAISSVTVNTIRVWAQRNTQGANTILFAYGTVYYGLWVNEVGDMIIVDETGNPIATWYTVFADKTAFHHVVLIHSAIGASGYVELYFDNSSKGVKNIATIAPARFVLGNGYHTGTYSGYGFNGYIKKVGFWSKALSSAEVAEDYNSGTPKDYPF